MKKAHAAVFVDRDGTIIEDTHYPRDPKQTVLLAGAAEGLRLMAEKGYLLVVVSNQSGVGRGIINESEFRAVHDKFKWLLQSQNIEVDHFAYCFHRPDENCACRKPNIGLIPKTYQKLPFDFSRSFTVGDNDCDLKLGDNLGTASFLVGTGKGRATQEALRETGQLHRYRLCSNLLEVAQILPRVNS